MRKLNWFNIFKAVTVRCFLAFHVIICTWRVVLSLNENYWMLLFALLPLIVESWYTVIKRQGAEFSRFTPCFFCYLGAIIPGIWFLELKKTDQYMAGGINGSSLYYNKDGDALNLELNPATWIIVIEEMMPYLIFISRWILPRGRVKREELAELLLAFIEIAADIMEFLSLLGENVIRSNKTLVYWVLGIWSLSVLQFTMTVTVIHQPKREKKIKVVVAESSKEKEWERIKHECGAIILTIAMQDMPFLIMRLYTIIELSRVTYSLIFFTSKNFIIITLLLYKVAVLCIKRYRPDHEDSQVEKDNIPENTTRHTENSKKNRELEIVESPCTEKQNNIEGELVKNKESERDLHIYLDIDAATDHDNSVLQTAESS